MAKSAPQGLETWKHGGTSATPQEKIEERIEITVFPHAARRRAALAHTPPARSLAHGETRDAPRSGTRRRCVAVGQGVARWRPRGGEAALTPRPGAHAPEVVARPRRTRRTRRRRRTRGRRGSPGAAAALLAPRAPRGRREAPSARRSSRKRAQTAPGLPTQDPCPFFFRIHNHIGRGGAVGAKKCGNRTIAGAGSRQSAKKCTFGELAPGVGCVSNFFFAHVKMCQSSGLRVQKNRKSELY